MSDDALARQPLAGSLLAFRPDGVPLGVLDAQCRARPPVPAKGRGRNAKSIEEKESFRWLEAFQQAADSETGTGLTVTVTGTDVPAGLFLSPE